MYDTVEIGPRVGQVKLWGEDFHDYFSGDRVPDIGSPTYSVAMREGGYLYVVERVIQRWEDAPMEGFPVFDKWGGLFDEATEGLLPGERYFYGGD